MADGRLRFTSEAGPIEVSVCTPRIVRVTLGAPAPLSFVEPRTWAPVAFESAGGEPVSSVATRDLRVEVETRPLRLAFADAAGEWLLREPDEGGMSVETGGRGGARVPVPGGAHLYRPRPGRGRAGPAGATRPRPGPPHPPRG